MASGAATSVGRVATESTAAAHQSAGDSSDALGAPAGFRGTFRTDLAARAVYSEAAGVGRILPRAVAVPADADDVVTLVRWAAADGHSLTARGSGSSMANGAIGPGVIVDLTRLREIGEPDLATQRIVVGPGVTRHELNAAVAHAGLLLPVDPSSSAFATIGGLVSTNAAGARTVKYGAMRAWIEGLDCVFADGTRAWVRRGDSLPDVPAARRFRDNAATRLRHTLPAALCHAYVRKQSSGYGVAEWQRSGSLVDLLVGSEGTLALIVGVQLRLAPLHNATVGLLATFPDLEGAAAAAGRVAALGASAAELLDRSFLAIAAREGNALPVELPPDTEAVLLVEVEEQSEGMAEHRVHELAAWCDAGGATFIEKALDDDSAQRLWALRHAASPILNRLAPRLQSMQLVEDGCVPRERLPEYVRGVREALDGARFRGIIFGHAGDGHAHVNALVDVTEPDWRERCTMLIEDVTRLVQRLGGTLAGEHGDGRLRAPLLPRVWSPEALAAFRAVKEAFDPDGILNPGVKLAAPGTTALADVKYDPTLAPLPTPARAALDHVVRHKAWNADRLALLEADLSRPPG